MTGDVKPVNKFFCIALRASTGFRIARRANIEKVINRLAPLYYSNGLDTDGTKPNLYKSELRADLWSAFQVWSALLDQT